MKKFIIYNKEDGEIINTIVYDGITFLEIANGTAIEEVGREEMVDYNFKRISEGVYERTTEEKIKEKLGTE